VPAGRRLAVTLIVDGLFGNDGLSASIDSVESDATADGLRQRQLTTVLYNRLRRLFGTTPAVSASRKRRRIEKRPDEQQL